MSLTSYRAAPPRVGGIGSVTGEGESWGDCGPGGDLLFRRLSGSTIGAEGFHGRVRDGIGCLAPRHGHQAGNALPPDGPPGLPLAGTGGGRSGGLSCDGEDKASGRRVRGLAAARGRFRALLAERLGSSPIERLVPVSCAGCPASTSGLSTWWSSTALGETWF